MIAVHELLAAGPVMNDGVAQVSCAVVRHPPVVPFFAYRFDLTDRPIVFSGDTAPSDALVRLASGADILVHEAAEFEQVFKMLHPASAAGAKPAEAEKSGIQPQGFDEQRFREHVEKAHTSVEDAGRVAAAAGVKTPVLNHLLPMSSIVMPDAVRLASAARHFHGTIIIGHDGLRL